MPESYPFIFFAFPPTTLLSFSVGEPPINFDGFPPLPIPLAFFAIYLLLMLDPALRAFESRIATLCFLASARPNFLAVCAKIFGGLTLISCPTLSKTSDLLISP